MSKYQRKLGRLLSRYIRDPAEVGTSLGKRSSRPIVRSPPFRRDSAFYTWLYRIGINTAKNYLVSQGRRAPTTTSSTAAEAETLRMAIN